MYKHDVHVYCNRDSVCMQKQRFDLILLPSQEIGEWKSLFGQNVIYSLLDKLQAIKPIPRIPWSCHQLRAAPSQAYAAHKSLKNWASLEMQSVTRSYERGSWPYY